MTISNPVAVPTPVVYGRIPRHIVQAVSISPTAREARQRERRRQQRIDNWKDVGVAAFCFVMAVVLYAMGRIDALGTLFR